MFDELVGKKIRIVPMKKNHIEGLYEISKEPSIWSHLPKAINTSLDMEAFVEEALTNKETKTEYPFVVILRENNKIIGTTRFLDVSTKNKSLEIGWTWYTPSVWGANINTECKYLLLKHCFETLKCIRVQLKTDERNIRSQKAIEKIGGVKEGVLRNHMIRNDGTYRNSVFYSVIERDWPLVERNLVNLLTNN
ncbi:GNAT family N-acetyltransferase [Metabacillus malikii]|uniref:RimJ/RimL family protein N-acetyltransferase n=1 Tax=Metabacillus malikii TaxID=1504265 RepID=A0ABT9ZD10_9BACI|nr:GNAT family protein [Metabacillus malikii]MDQ0230156.1 RimJ/RimL family protein N-acetyltransferase [Metabacillus malikii]